MSAYNWISFDSDCPVCQRDTTIKAQTHVASDYDGDDSGRFHDRLYRLGETMRWWPEQHPRFSEWKNEGFPNRSERRGDECEEACYARCEACGAKLCAVIEFRRMSPVRILKLGLEDDWPDGYLR